MIIVFIAIVGANAGATLLEQLSGAIALPAMVLS
jgi:uncharacterized transporter YbjL